MKRKLFYPVFIILLCMMFSQKVFANGQIHSLSVSTLSITKNSQETFYWLMCNNKLDGYTNKKENQHAYFSESLSSSRFDLLLDNAFASSDKNDLNFFYFTGHTIFESVDPPTKPLGINLNVSTHSYYTYRELAKKLNSYKGKMVVIIDTCGSEAFIRDGIGALSDKSHIYALCSCGYTQESEFGYGILNPFLFFNGYRYNAFTYSLGKGLGFFDVNKKLLADSNSDGAVSLAELFTYTKSNIKTVNQVMDVKAYPTNSSLNVFSYTSAKTPTTIKLSSTTMTCFVSEKKVLSVSGIRSGTKVTWKSSNSKIAIVNSKGQVTAKKAGTVTIFATANGKTAKCRITVKKPSIKLNKTSATIYSSGITSVQLKATVKGASSKVTWKSSNTKIATVSSNGKVTAKKAGTVTITAKANGVSGKCKVTVKTETEKQKAMKAYTNYMATQPGKGEWTTVRFSVAYIDNDDVPELIKEVDESTQVFSYVNGKVRQLIDVVRLVDFAYYPKKGVFRVTGGESFAWDDYCVIKNGKASFVFGSNDIEAAEFFDTWAYYRYNKNGNQEKMSKNEFEKLLKQYVGSTKIVKCRYYSNTASNRKKYLG